MRLNFVVGIALLLATTCVTWTIECYLKYLYVSQTGADDPCYSQEDTLAKSYCTWFTIFEIANMVCYNVGMWLFAMRYWTLSKILEMTLKKENPDSQFKMLAAVTWIGFSFFVLMSLAFSLLMFYGQTARVIFVTPAFMWTIIFFFLLSALYRIK